MTGTELEVNAERYLRNVYLGENNEISFTDTETLKEVVINLAIDEAFELADKGEIELKSGSDLENSWDKGYDEKVNNVDGKLPYVEKAFIDSNKLVGYALNSQHPQGSNKARVFESALGFNSSNADALMEQVYSKLPKYEAVIGVIDEYGQRFTVDIPITGPNRNTVNVRTGWIIREGTDIPTLTTIYVKNK